MSSSYSSSSRSWSSGPEKSWNPDPGTVKGMACDALKEDANAVDEFEEEVVIDGGWVPPEAEVAAAGKLSQGALK